MSGGGDFPFISVGFMYTNECRGSSIGLNWKNYVGSFVCLFVHSFVGSVGRPVSLFIYRVGWLVHWLIIWLVGKMQFYHG